MDDHELTHLLISLYYQREGKINSIFSGELTLEEQTKTRKEIDHIENQLKELLGY